MTTRTTTVYARIGLSLSVGLLMICAGLQVAEAAPKRLGVVTFRGPGEGATRNAVMKAAKANRYEIVGGQQIAKTASKLKVTLDTNDSFLAVARELGVSAFVTGEVTKKKATLTVRNGADGSVSAEASWTGPNPRKLSAAVSKTFWRRLGSAIDRTKAPSGSKQSAVAEEEAAPETGADEPGDDEGEKSSAKKSVAAASEESGGAGSGDEGSRESSRRSKKKKSSDEDSDSENVVSEKADLDDDEGGSGAESLIVSAGPRVVSRSLTYTDDLMRRNSKYSLGAAPEVGLNVDFYPAAALNMGGFASNLGLTAGFTYMLPVVTSPGGQGSPAGSKYGTYSMNWSIGAKVRLPMGFFATVAFGDHRYQLTPSGGATGLDVPMVDYRYVRLGTGGRFKVTPYVSLMANLAYLHCLSLGQIRSTAYFPKATCGALEAGGAVGIRLTQAIELQLGADIRRYGLNFHVVPADQNIPGRRIAGGAVDQYLMGYVAVAVVMGGGGGGSSARSEPAEEEEAPAPKKVVEDDADADEGDPEPEAPKPAAKKKSSKRSDDLDL